MTIPLSTESLERFQFAGQDIPWLVEHWARVRPDHPVLIWEPRSAQGDRWSYRAFAEKVAS